MDCGGQEPHGIQYYRKQFKYLWRSRMGSRTASPLEGHAFDVVCVLAFNSTEWTDWNRYIIDNMAKSAFDILHMYTKTSLDTQNPHKCKRSANAIQSVPALGVIIAWSMLCFSQLVFSLPELLLLDDFRRVYLWFLQVLILPFRWDDSKSSQEISSRHHQY